MTNDERDAARYRWLREQVRVAPVLAQALFWNNSSRGEFDRAVDAAIEAERPTSSPLADPKTANEAHGFDAIL